MADLRYREVPHDGVVAANFKMAQAEFILLVLQRAFHRPTGKADMQNDFERRSRIGIAKEVAACASRSKEAAQAGQAKHLLLQSFPRSCVLSPWWFAPSHGKVPAGAIQKLFSGPHFG